MIIEFENEEELNELFKLYGKSSYPDFEVFLRQFIKPKPKKFRPFKNAEEFKPHRDRWVKLNSSIFCFYKPLSYS